MENQLHRNAKVMIMIKKITASLLTLINLVSISWANSNSDPVHVRVHLKRIEHLAPNSELGPCDSKGNFYTFTMAAQEFYSKNIISAKLVRCGLSSVISDSCKIIEDLTSRYGLPIEKSSTTEKIKIVESKQYNTQNECELEKQLVEKQGYAVITDKDFIEEVSESGLASMVTEKN